MENTELIISIIALVISILSLLASVVFAILEIIETKNAHKNNIAFEFIKEAYKEYMVTKIPEAYRLIRFDPSNKLKDTKVLQDTILELKKESRYFKFSDDTFFKILEKKVSDLQDFLGKNEGMIFEETEDQYECKKEIINKINDIYTCINKKLSTGKAT